MTTIPRLAHDPHSWLLSAGSTQAALVRRRRGMPALPRDGEAIQRTCQQCVDHIAAEDEPRQEPFQKSYGEYLIAECAPLRAALAALVARQGQTRGRVGHYELYAGLVMGDQPEEVLTPTLAELHDLLRTWDNRGWCPWTPALWLRILWLGRELLDASAAMETQLRHLDAHVGADGQFQDREPFCLMHAVSGIDHPLADGLRERFLAGLCQRQQDDGGWGDFGYIAHCLLQRWAML